MNRHWTVQQLTVKPKQMQHAQKPTRSHESAYL